MLACVVGAAGCHGPKLSIDDAPPLSQDGVRAPGSAIGAAPAARPLSAAPTSERDAAPPCATDGWATYGHDAARTSASGGCVRGPMHAAWKLAPRCASGCPAFVTRAIAEGDAVYASGALGPMPVLWRADATQGSFQWTYLSKTESVRGGWPTLAGGKVYLVDDGVNEADARTGAGHRAELDAWGESLSDGARLFAENDWYLDGYGLYLSAFTAGDLRLLWRRDYNALARGVMVPDVGGLALDAGVLVHSAQHGPLTGSGVSAFDPATGERRWRARVSPFSSPSIAQGRVFTIERWPGEHVDRLAARSLGEGKLLWASEMADARGPAPVLAGGRVVVHGKAGLVAFDAATGVRLWSAPIARTTEPVQSATTLAAAVGSGTVVALSGASVHLVRLDDGTTAWSGQPVAHARHLEGPVVVGDALFVVADGAIVRLDSAPGPLLNDASSTARR